MDTFTEQLIKEGVICIDCHNYIGPAIYSVQSCQHCKRHKRKNARANKKVIWTTKEGTKIPVRDMADSHLVNTIKLIQRKFESFQNNLLNEAEEIDGFLSSDLANDTIELDMFTIANSSIEQFLPIYRELTKEARFRHLNVK